MCMSVLWHIHVAYYMHSIQVTVCWSGDLQDIQVYKRVLGHNRGPQREHSGDWDYGPLMKALALHIAFTHLNIL